MDSILLNLLIVTLVIAQTPNQFKYQAVLRNAEGTILANENVNVDISILQGGTEVFTESHSVTTTEQGLINLNIGSFFDLSIIDWAGDIYFIEISVNGTVMGTSQLLSVPYALHAKTVENDQVNDADFDPANELQDLSLTGNNLAIENGNNVDLSGYLDDQTVTISTGDGIEVTGTYPDFTITNIGDIDPNDDVTLSNPTTGDMLYYNGTGWSAITQGTNGQVLTMSEGQPIWQNSSQVYFNPVYPDGLQGITPFIQDNLLTTNYSVPAGKNLYILNIHHSTNTLTEYLFVENTIIIEGLVNYGVNSLGLSLSLPIIVAQTETISASNDNFIINGFLIDSKVSPFTKKSLNSISYVVPVAKQFYLLNIYHKGAAGDKIYINGLPIAEGYFNVRVNGHGLNLTQPVILNEGDVITSDNDTSSINGYLIGK